MRILGKTKPDLPFEIGLSYWTEKLSPGPLAPCIALQGLGISLASSLTVWPGAKPDRKREIADLAVIGGLVLT